VRLAHAITFGRPPLQEALHKKRVENMSSMSRTVVRAVRSRPHIYSAVCKGRLFLSRFIASAADMALYRRNKRLFVMTALEKKHYDDLRDQGFTILHDFFDPKLVDRIYDKADQLFRDLQIDFHDAYSVQNKQRSSLEGLSYKELEASEKMISLEDPLLNIPECIGIAFNESILKITTNFLGYVAPRFKPMVVRDFPSDRPRESSNFHRDNDEADSLQFFVYLVDIDDARGPLVYIPATNRYDVKSCRPRPNRDLGIDENDGRISDKEIEKYYPKWSWLPIKVRRGSVAIIHANGFHKGPSWANYGDPRNKPRTALRFDLAGYKIGVQHPEQERKIRREDYQRLSELQKLFTRGFMIVGDGCELEE
jgi:Phytanoyl-CoA dioxygenase (PhyH)